MRGAARSAMVVAAAAVWLASPSVAEGQQRTTSTVPETGIGSRVRVRAPGLRSDRFVGQITAVTPDSMTIDTSGARRRLGFDTGPVLVAQYRYATIPMAEVESIEVSVGRTHAKTTLLGVGIGALAGGLITGGGNLPTVNPGFSDFAKGFATGAVLGAVVGGTVGYLLGGDKWVPAARPTGTLPPK